MPTGRMWSCCRIASSFLASRERCDLAPLQVTTKTSYAPGTPPARPTFSTRTLSDLDAQAILVVDDGTYLGKLSSDQVESDLVRILWAICLYRLVEPAQSWTTARLSTCAPHARS